MNYEDFINSRVEMTKTQFLNAYFSERERKEFDALKMYVYVDYLYISMLKTNKYQVIIGNREFIVPSLYQAEKVLWKEWAKGELKNR